MFLTVWFLSLLIGFVTLLLTQPNQKRVSRAQVLVVILVSLLGTVLVVSGVWEAVSGFFLSIAEALLSGDV